MLEDGFRSLAVTGKPVEAHLSVQRLVIVRQREPVDEGQVDDGDQLVISVQHDVNDPNTIVLVR